MSKMQLKNSQKRVDKQLERSKRQAILMRLVDENKDEPPNFSQLAAKMRENQWVAARWPSYSHQTANKDFNEVMNLVRDDIKTLAMPYFVRQVEVMDEAIDILREFANDTQLPPKLRIDAINAQRGYLEQMGRTFGNFAPKEMHIKKEELTYNLDTYLQLKNQAAKQLQVLDVDIVDSEVIE